LKVIFLKDVPPTARAGDIRVVKNGFARNYLLPNGLADLATKEVVARAAGLRREAEQRRLSNAADWRTLGEALAETPVVVNARSGPTGRLYGSITPAIVAQRLFEITGRTVDRRAIRFPTPVRQTGQFTIPVRLYEDVQIDIKLVVVAESVSGADEPIEPSQDLEADVNQAAESDVVAGTTSEPTDQSTDQLEAERES